MTRSNIISVYLLLSIANGLIPLSIALFFSVPMWEALFIWVSTSLMTFLLVSFVCLRSALRDALVFTEAGQPGNEIERAYF